MLHNQMVLLVGLHVQVWPVQGFLSRRGLRLCSAIRLGHGLYPEGGEGHRLDFTSRQAICPVSLFSNGTGHGHSWVRLSGWEGPHLHSQLCGARHCAQWSSGMAVLSSCLFQATGSVQHLGQGCRWGSSGCWVRLAVTRQQLD